MPSLGNDDILLRGDSSLVPNDSISLAQSVNSLINDAEASASSLMVYVDERRSFFKKLSEGFSFIRQASSEVVSANSSHLQSVVSPPNSVLPSFLSKVTVNFIDPTTSSIMMSTTPSGVGYSAAVKKAKMNQSIQLYEKFISIFEHEYKSQLTDVPYELFRSSAVGEIDVLPIHPVVSRGHGGGMISLPVEDKSTNQVPPIHGDFLWEQPYCHVYLAACENMDHYRTKVKPSIQVFISQLEAAVKASSSSQQSRFRRSSRSPVVDGANNTSLDESISGMDASTNSRIGPSSNNKKIKRVPPAPRYVIVYIPTGDRSNSRSGTDSNAESNGSPKKGSSSVSASAKSGGTSTALGASVASRFAAARQRMTAVAVARTTSNSTMATADAATTILDNQVEGNEGVGVSGLEEEAVVQLPPSIQKLNRTEREIARRFANDFPCGNVCTLSTLLDSSTLSEVTSSKVDDDDIAKTDEAIKEDDDGSSHFQKLEWNAVLKAMASAIAASFQDRCQRFDDEIRKLDQNRRGDAVSATKQVIADMDELSNIASSEDFHLSHFFLVKESLAFTYEQMRLPAEALLQYEELRAFLPDRDFAANVVTRTSSSCDVSQEKALQSALEGDALEFRRLLKLHGVTVSLLSAAEQYLFAREISLLFQMNKSVRVIQRCLMNVQELFQRKKRTIESSVATDASRQSLIDVYKWAFCHCWDIYKASDCLVGDVAVKSAVNVACARCLCDILEYARQCLDAVGEIVLPGRILCSYGQEFVQSIQGPWAEWHEPFISQSTDLAQDVFITPMEFIEQALSSKTSFSTRYCEVLQMIAACNEYCGRRRLAARVRIERLEILNMCGDKENCAKEISSILSVYRTDQWSACHFALLFRLASFQRDLSPPPEYMETLVRCFYEEAVSIAPQNALLALHADLASIINSKCIAGTSFSAAPLFGPIFGLEGMAKPSVPGSDRTLLKRLYAVGDTVRVNLSLHSFLPAAIHVEQISINLVSFRTYVAAMEDNLAIESGDVLEVLSLPGATVSSGNNGYTLDWLPKSSGQFIIASVSVRWNGVTFLYSAKELRRPTIRVDVVPCTPTQKLQVKPKYLFLGHEQPISIELNANADAVIHGTLRLQGPSHVKFASSESKFDSSEWASPLVMSLSSCEPGKTIFVKALAKVDLPHESLLSRHSVEVNVATAYSFTSNEGIDLATENLKASFDGTIEIPGKAALTVRCSNIVSYSVGKAVINAVLDCNSPTYISLKSWSMELPPFLQVSDVGDMNKALENKNIICGDRVSFSFDCSCLESASGAGLDVTLEVTFENELGTNLTEVLKIRLKPFIERSMRVLDVKATNVTISSPVTQCAIGLPVVLKYSIDISGCSALSGLIVYEIASSNIGWIICGRNIGIVKVSESKSFDIAIVAIPVQPGTIVDYPRISLTSFKDNCSTILPVTVSAPPSFIALSPSVHSAVAFPIVKESKEMFSTSEAPSID
jgi:trafficking protein particle complex subunit 10